MTAWDMEEGLYKSVAGVGGMGGVCGGIGALVISFPATAAQIAYWKIKVMVN